MNLIRNNLFYKKLHVFPVLNAWIMAKAFKYNHPIY